MRRLLTIVLTLTLAMHMVGQTVWHHREAGCSAEASVAAKRRVADRLFTRAMLEMEERHFDAGYELLRQVQVISPDHSAAIFMQSTFESILRHDSIAEVLLRQCVTLDPNNPSYIEAMGAWYDRHDSVQQATRQYEKLLSLERQRTDVARHLHTHRHSIDRPALEAKLNELGLMHAWQSVGCFLHIYLGMDTDDIPFYDSSKEQMAEKIAKRLRKKVLYHRESKWKRPKGRISSKLYSYIHYFGVAWELLPIFPKESTAYLLQTTTQGLKILFRKANRTGTREHYLQRNSQEQSQE